MSRKILIVEKTGVIKELMVKVFDEADLFKKAGFKSAEGFERRGGWTMSNGVVVSLYGKVTGRAGQENKYDFPPPIDKTLFFGSCVLVAEENSLKKSEWEGYYEELFGGFEDIGDEDSTESEDEDDEDDALPKTKSGYAKDGFIVDDDDDDDDEDDDEETDDEEEDEPILVTKKNVKKTKPVKEKAVRKGKPTVFEKIETDSAPEENLFLDCTSELVEETYE